MFQMGNPPVPLCVHCQEKASHIGNIEFLKAAAMSNQALDDMNAVLPIPPILGGHIPVGDLARAMQRGHTLNHIVVNNSRIGILNTGSIQKIDAAITLTEGSDAQTVGKHLKSLTEAVAKDGGLPDEAKREVIELIETLASQIVGQRKPSVIDTLMKGIREKVSGVIALATAAAELWEAVKPLLGG
jgi:hypothetical protein